MNSKQRKKRFKEHVSILKDAMEHVNMDDEFIKVVEALAIAHKEIDRLRKVIVDNYTEPKYEFEY